METGIARAVESAPVGSLGPKGEDVETSLPLLRHIVLRGGPIRGWYKIRHRGGVRLRIRLFDTWIGLMNRRAWHIFHELHTRREWRCQSYTNIEIIMTWNTIFCYAIHLWNMYQTWHRSWKSYFVCQNIHIILVPYRWLWSMQPCHPQHYTQNASGLEWPARADP